LKYINKTAVVIALLVAPFITLSQIKVSNADGTVGFSGKHAGMTFSGEFLKWNAQLLLPPASNAYVNAEFDLRTAETGDSTYDDTLPEGDWFDVDNHPQGTFVSEEVIQTSEGYQVSGKLSLRGKALPVSFLLQEDGGRLTSQFKIDRLSYGIGFESDPDADWVSKYIELTLDIPKQ
jgi:polyisoprenoid-binding protein YceI